MSAANYPVTFGYLATNCARQPLTVDGDTTTIHATRGDILIDTEDLGLVYDFVWNVQTRGDVASTNRNTKKVKLHRLIMGFPKTDVDHINGNPLDNRKTNLRIAAHKDNSRNTKLSKNNTSGYNGVVWRPERKKWEARIKHDYKNILLGRFKDIEDAASCRYAASITLLGEYAGELRHG